MSRHADWYTLTSDDIARAIETDDAAHTPLTINRSFHDRSKMAGIYDTWGGTDGVIDDDESVDYVPLSLQAGRSYGLMTFSTAPLDIALFSSTGKEQDITPVTSWSDPHTGHQWHSSGESVERFVFDVEKSGTYYIGIYCDPADRDDFSSFEAYELWGATFDRSYDLSLVV